ncbi:MAG TPA: NAD(P)-binding domain-containing protein [Bacteroidales bacterium]|nr:NAD(P)-binding domain-containing protein [Bacteroidales bacterium]HPS61925.1 NAD(P)-binding domain-containing protein [Bacteroidales bacterium]
MLTEKILIYGSAILLCLAVILIYLWKQRRDSRRVDEKIAKAKQDGVFEPVSLHPVIDPGSCIGTGACIAACPEKDILGLRNGKATTINASHCVGHGACFHACPTRAITLCIGTEKRGVDLPHMNARFETNLPGVYIAGELGGMGLIRNAVEQGRQAVENMVKSGIGNHGCDYDLVIVGAGPAGISASLTARRHHLRFLTLEQDTLGGTVFTFPRSKVVMTATMELPLYGKLKLSETSKSQLLAIWQEALGKNGITVRENTRVENILSTGDGFRVDTSTGEQVRAYRILLAIERRGTPRKLGIPGEDLEKVAYRLLEPEHIHGKRVMVVGGGDSAIESALLLAANNTVTLTYRGESFSRIKPKNGERIREANQAGTVDIRFNTNPVRIDQDSVALAGKDGVAHEIPNDLVFIFAGGELPTQFLQKVGLHVTTKYGDAVLKHD